MPRISLSRITSIWYPSSIGYLPVVYLMLKNCDQGLLVPRPLDESVHGRVLTSSKDSLNDASSPPLLRTSSTISGPLIITNH